MPEISIPDIKRDDNGCPRPTYLEPQRTGIAELTMSDPVAFSGPKSTRIPRRTESLAEQVYARLRQEILSCQIKPGEDLSEAELAARFDVSKTPVREALAKLRQEDLVRAFPRRGYQVTEISFKDMNELFDLRTLLEAGAAAMACDRITDAELDTLGQLARVDYDQHRSPTLDPFIEANRAFHVAIARASGNERIHRMIEQHLSQLERYFYIGARSRDISTETTREHLEIVDALASRDPQRARDLMIRHNTVTREGLFDCLADSRRSGAINL